MTDIGKINFQEIKDALDKIKGIDVLTNRIAILEEEVTALKKYVPSIIFHANVSDGRNPSAPQSYVIYDSVILNKGSAYCPLTGVFSAPLAGTYSFTYSLIGGTSSNNTSVYLMRNGSRQSYIHSILGGEQAQTGSMTTILSLDKGDQVWVELATGIAWSGTGAMCFEGVLLEAK
ncbi:complement C1q tumor necrosis factor-related protein 3-like [Scyliorhinus torazame]|uniref:complement C1q tumor necrosis factor-related protein 3-like n=1 Tax=Scyliorhinus torazame TaxID=75743 RepID=UPI003B59CC8C